MGAAIDLHLAFLVATATAFDNLSEALNIGQLHRETRRRDERPGTRWRLGHTTDEMVIRHYAKFIPNLTRQDGSALSRVMQDQGLG